MIATLVGSPPKCMWPNGFGFVGSVISIMPNAFAGLSLYTSFMPSAVAAIISADVSSALGLFAGVPNFPISLKSAFTVLTNAVEARRPAS